MWGEYASLFDYKWAFTSRYVKSKSFVRVANNLDALEPCLISADYETFFFFPMSVSKSSSSKDAWEKYSSAAWVYVRLLERFRAGVDLVVA